MFRLPIGRLAAGYLFKHMMFRNIMLPSAEGVQVAGTKPLNICRVDCELDRKKAP